MDKLGIKYEFGEIQKMGLISLVPRMHLTDVAIKFLAPMDILVEESIYIMENMMDASKLYEYMKNLVLV